MESYVTTKIIACVTREEKASGMMPEHLEVEMYGSRPSVTGTRSPRTGKPTCEKKQQANDRASVKKLRRYLKTSFRNGLYVTYTFTLGRRPRTLSAVMRMARLYFQNLSDRCARRGIDIMWLYVVEIGEKGGAYHIHAFLSSNVPREQVLRGWVHGHVDIRAIPTDAEEIEQIAGYSLKSPKGAHGWHRSRNITEPVVETDDKLVSASEFGEIARNGFRYGDVMELMGRLFPGYRVLPLSVSGEYGYYCETMESPYLAVALQRQRCV